MFITYLDLNIKHLRSVNVYDRTFINLAAQNYEASSRHHMVSTLGKPHPVRYPDALLSRNIHFDWNNTA